MKKLVSLLLAFFSIGLLGAQNELPPCGTDKLLARNPFLHSQRISCAPEVTLDTAQVLTIPIVVHVVHLGEAIGVETNISDEQILSMVDNLNHRFRRDINALTSLTDVYDENELSLALDSKIQFCLASRDPDNNPTDGILRHNGSGLTSGGESYAEDGVSTGLGGGIDQAVLKIILGCWDTSRYFNFWIVSEINGNNGGSGVQGVSYLGPTGNNCLYGPLCLYNVVGTTGTLKPGRDLNATMTHEIGHAFGLYHTFNGGCQSTSTCTNGDFIADTPATNGSYGCTSSSDCPDAMVENYMDYTSQNCKIAFTQNQIETMRDQIWTQLPGLVIDNINCQSPNSKDLAITNVTLPTEWCSETVNFSVKISNLGTDIANNAILILNNQSYPLPILLANEYEIIEFTDYFIGDGLFNLELIYNVDEYLNNNFYSTEVILAEQNWIEILLDLGNFPSETDWEILDENGGVVYYGGNYESGTELVIDGVCLPNGCYTFKITDTAGDGLCDIDFGNDGVCDIGGSLEISSNGSPIISIPNENSNYGSEKLFNFCPYYCSPESCKGDFDNDGVVGIQDLLTFLATPQGQLNDCSEYDFNNDLQINLNDLLNLLSLYGTSCSTGENILGTPPEWTLDCINEYSSFNTTNVTETIDNGVCKVGPPIYFDIAGRRVNEKGDLAPGIYILVQKWSNGNITTKKIFLNS